MSQVATDVRKCFSQTEAGERLGLSRKAVSRLIKMGELKTRKMPPGVRSIVLASSVEELLARMEGGDQVK